jgi:hypothetical protein
VHKYLGMTLDYSENEALSVHMKKYIELMLNKFAYKLGKKNEKYPWNENLFKNLNYHNANAPDICCKGIVIGKTKKA